MHKTSRFESHEVDLIVRRGLSFDVSFNLTNVTEQSLSHLSLQLMYTWGEPEFIVIRCRKDFNDNQSTWSSDMITKHVKDSQANITFRVSVPPKAAIGSYSLQLKEDDQVIWDSKFTNNATLYVLFNPYDPLEPSYMDNRRHLQEYLESDLGAVFLGGSLYRGGQYWMFGQYSSAVLKGLMKLLDAHYDASEKIHIDYQLRTDPVLLSRWLGDIMNDVDSDLGLMQGNWDGDYSDGVEPTDWISSVPIYEQYLNTGETVKYAQCWVFGAVATTAFRTLGIPARPITTYDSAHNSRDDLMVHRCNDTSAYAEDRHFCSDDSIWNFHSWTEVWLSRGDMCDETTGKCIAGLSGWQVIDGTPQEASVHDDSFAVGPSSKNAILTGRVTSNYDSSFVFAEVAAPVVTWGIYNNSLRDPISVSFTRVGSKIVTKKLNSSGTDYEDITDSYKYRDAEWHRVTLINAFFEKGVNTEILGHKLILDPLVDITVNKKPHIIVGEPIELNVTVKNNDHQNNQTVRYSLQLDSVYYTGIVSRNVMNQEFNVTLQPNETHSHLVVVPFNDYYLKLVESMHLNLITRLHAAESDYSHLDQDDFVLHTPDVSVVVLDKAMPSQPLNLMVSFKNSLPFSLNSCYLRIDGLRNLSSRVKLPKVRVNDTMTTKVTVTYDSSPVVFATVDCRELENIRGSVKVN